jgi:WD40 repeat protein
MTLRSAGLALAIVIGIAVGVWLATDKQSRTGQKPAADQRPGLLLPSEIYSAKVVAAALNGNGIIALATSKGVVRILRLPSGQPPIDMAVLPGERLGKLAISDDGSTVAGASGKPDFPDKVWAWRVGTRWVASGKAFSNALTLSGDGRKLAVAGSDIGVYDLEQNSRTVIYPKPRPGSGGVYESMVFTRGDQRLQTAATTGVDLWNTRTSRQLPATLDCSSCGAISVSLSRGGRFVGYGTNDGHVLVWAITERRVVLERTVSARPHDSVSAVAVTPDGSRVSAGTAPSGQIVTYDVRTGMRIDQRTTTKHAGVQELSITDDGQTLLVEAYASTAPYEKGTGERWLVHLPSRNQVAQFGRGVGDGSIGRVE